ASQTFTLPSPLATQRRWPSGRNATLRTGASPRRLATSFSVRRSQTFTSAPNAAARYWPSQLKVTLVAIVLGPPSVWTISAVRMSQIRMFDARLPNQPSSVAAARYWLSELNVTGPLASHQGPPGCRVRACCSVVASQTFTVLSRHAEARNLPLGLKATL